MPNHPTRRNIDRMRKFAPTYARKAGTASRPEPEVTGRSAG